MNLKKINLNLLVIFDALITEQHVTKAGEKLGLSQPAMSYALKHLRQLFNDKLFIKSTDGIVPTAKAIALMEPIKAALLRIEEIVQTQEKFDPLTSQKIFKLGLSDYATAVILPLLTKYVEETAPHISFEVLHLNAPEKSRLLDTGEIDLAIGVFDKKPSRLEHEFLFREKVICVASKNNKLLRGGLSLEKFIALPHLLVSFREDPPFAIQKSLAALGLKRHVAITVPHVMAVPHILQDSNLISAIPYRVARIIPNELELKMYELPIDLQQFNVYQIWHRRHNSDVAHSWLRNIIAEIFFESNSSSA